MRTLARDCKIRRREDIPSAHLLPSAVSFGYQFVIGSFQQYFALTGGNLFIAAINSSLQDIFVCLFFTILLEPASWPFQQINTSQLMSPPQRLLSSPLWFLSELRDTNTYLLSRTYSLKCFSSQESSAKFLNFNKSNLFLFSFFTKDSNCFLQFCETLLFPSNF